MFKTISITTSVLLLAGCASMFNGTTQPFSVSTSNDKAKESTHCTIVNEEGSWQAPPNQTATIHRDGNIMSVNCDNKYQNGTNYVDSKFDGGYLLLDLLTGYGMVLGIAIDGANNAFYTYPNFVSIAMQDKPGIAIPKQTQNDGTLSNITTQAPSPKEFEKTIPKIASNEELALTNYFDKIPENWPQKIYYETDEFRYWSIPGEIVTDQNEATLSSKNKADIILSKEFPNKPINTINYETTHMELLKYNGKYRSWRLVRIRIARI